MTDITLLRLVTGEVLAGRKTDNSDNTVTISNPLLLGLSQNPQNGQLTVTMMPYMPFSKDVNYDFQRSHILGEFAPTDDLEREIQSKTSTVFVPSKPKLIV